MKVVDILHTDTGMTFIVEDDDGRVWHCDGCTVLAMKSLDAADTLASFEFEKLVADPERPRDPT